MRLERNAQALFPLIPAPLCHPCLGPPHTQAPIEQRRAQRGNMSPHAVSRRGPAPATQRERGGTEEREDWKENMLHNRGEEGEGGGKEGRKEGMKGGRI